MEIVAGLPLKYLRLESPSSPINISQVLVFHSSTAKAVTPSLEAIQFAVYRQISTQRALRQRLVESPFQLANPVWLDDPHMDIQYHVQQHNLVDTTSTNPLTAILEVAAQLAAHQFDRASPLWRIHLITLAKPNMFAFVCVTHRALLCRLHQTLFDAIFPENLDFDEHQTIESLAMECPKTGSKFGFRWIPESLPSRNDLLKLAKSDWLTIPKQTKALGTMMVGRWAKRKIATAIVDKNDLPPNWISAPQSIFNQPTGKNRDLAFIKIPASTSRNLLRVYKNFDIKDLVLALLSRTLKTFLETKDHHTKDELVALVQSNSLLPHFSETNQEENIDDYQLIRLPTNTHDPIEQLQSILERRNTAREYHTLFNKSSDLGIMPSSVLSWLIHTYNKFGIHHFHKPFCNLVISEQPPTCGAQILNGFTRSDDASFASLLPNIGLHISYWLTKDSACISFTTGSTEFKAQELADAFSDSLLFLESRLEQRWGSSSM